MAWIDVRPHGFVNESAIDYIEIVSEERSMIIIHTIGGREIEMSGLVAYNIMEYLRFNKVEFLTRLNQPVGLDGLEQ